MSVDACPRCRRTLSARSPDPRFCPHCGVLVNAPAAAPVHTPAAILRGGVDLAAVADRQRQLLLSILLTIGAQFVLLTLRWPRGPAVLILVAQTAVFILCVIRLLTALRTNPGWITLAVLLMLAPCLNLLVLLIINGRASVLLQRAGVKVGFFGTTGEEVRRRLAPYYCAQCGSSLMGETSSRCPECGTTI